MKQLLITTHLYTFAVICVIATTISSCTFKKKTDMETPTGTKENELTMLVGTYTSGDSKGIYSFRFNEETGTATALISQFLLTENLFIQSVNSIMNRRPPMHLPSIRKKELLNY
mgnify:CR=1 FL=1